MGQKKQKQSINKKRKLSKKRKDKVTTRIESEPLLKDQKKSTMDGRLDGRTEQFMRQQSQSTWAIVTTSFLYVINDLRKKKRQFAIGISTIFMTVSVVTFLDCLIGLAPVVTMVASQSTVGDFDLQLTRLKDADFVAQGKHNFEVESGFFEAGRNESRSFYDKMTKSNALPTLNHTYFSEALKQQGNVDVRLFPRWNALSKV